MLYEVITDVIGTVNALEQRLEDITTPIDVSIIGCVVNGPGEALVSDLGLAGANKRSAFYEQGERVDRLDNDTLIDTLEARIRARAARLATAFWISWSVAVSGRPSRWHNAFFMASSSMGSRITSYNVCYTKLLRDDGRGSPARTP